MKSQTELLLPEVDSLKPFDDLLQLGPGVPQGQRGAPYSATKETQTIQTLSDGTAQKCF
jgi:hypothetical protein